MKKLLFITALLALSFYVRGQEVTVNTLDKINYCDAGYQIKITVSPKKATQLIADQIKGKQDNIIVTPARTINALYEFKKYRVDTCTFQTVNDLRKYVREEIRKDLNIN